MRLGLDPDWGGKPRKDLFVKLPTWAVGFKVRFHLTRTAALLHVEWRCPPPFPWECFSFCEKHFPFMQIYVNLMYVFISLKGHFCSGGRLVQLCIFLWEQLFDSHPEKNDCVEKMKGFLFYVISVCALNVLADKHKAYFCILLVWQYCSKVRK